MADIAFQTGLSDLDLSWHHPLLWGAAPAIQGVRMAGLPKNGKTWTQYLLTLARSISAINTFSDSGTFSIVIQACTYIHLRVMFVRTIICAPHLTTIEQLVNSLHIQRILLVAHAFRPSLNWLNFSKLRMYHDISHGGICPDTDMHLRVSSPLTTGCFPVDITLTVTGMVLLFRDSSTLLLSCSAT